MDPQPTQSFSAPSRGDGDIRLDVSAGPGDLPGLLGEHCRAAGAEGGAILRVAGDGRVDILAVWPAPGGDEEPPGWLRRAVALAGETPTSGEPAAVPLPDDDQLYDQPAGRELVLTPLPEGAAGMRGVAAFVTRSDGRGPAAASVGRMLLSVPALGLYALHLAAPRRSAAAARLEPALAVLAAVNEHDHFLAAAMAFCNELAAPWRCERVGLGFLRGRYVELKAINHAEKFSRKMRVVGLIEAAMEECLDQDVEVLHPPGEEGDFVSRAARELSRDDGHMTVLSLPLRRGGAPVGAVTLERPAETPFEAEEIEPLRLTCDLCTARLLDLRARDRWIGARAAGGLRAGLAAVIGPRHTWLKVLAAAVLAGAIWLGTSRSDYRVDAPFVLQATRQQIVGAPFDGQVEAVHVEVGDTVAPQAVLAELKTLPLQREVNRLEAELFDHRKQADSARAEKKWAEAQMAGARARQLTERIELLREQIDSASVKALIAGTVVKGDLERFVGAPVAKGQVLFEIAPIASLRAELSVPADQIADLQAAMRAGPVGGSLAAASFPDRKIGLTVGRLRPMAEEEDGRAVFKVRAELARTESWMRPGMAGVAHVTLDRRRTVWVWTRRLVNWVRIRLWL